MLSNPSANALRLLCVLSLLNVAPGFVVTQSHISFQGRQASSTSRWANSNGKLTKEDRDNALELLERARLLREEIEASQPTRTKQPTLGNDETKASSKYTSPWSVSEVNSSGGSSYRFYVDIGREQGTWMEPRWGASGARIEFTLDVRFTDHMVDKEIANQMVNDNRGASSSPVYRLETAPYARLRGGFDRMKCYSGAYRIDTSNDKKQKTLRLFFQTKGKQVGDISVPTDSHLYVSLPVLADSSLSRKEGIVSVRQHGWHTGWYRLESRIVGVVRALRLKDAREKDGF